jgi:hypothetical protein
MRASAAAPLSARAREQVALLRVDRFYRTVRTAIRVGGGCFGRLVPIFVDRQCRREDHGVLGRIVSPLGYPTRVGIFYRGTRDPVGYGRAMAEAS